MDGKLKKQLPVRTQMVWYLLAIVLILVASGLRVLDRGMYNSFWSVWLQLLRHMIHIGLLIGWMISIQSRILQRPVRRYLLAIGCMLSFWLFVRASKWMLFAHDSQMNRYCWYSYYIPMVLIPLLGGMLLPHIGQSERHRPGKSRRLWYIPAVSLMGLVLTNDLHQLVFRFPDGIVFFQNRYTYQIGYFVIFAWCLLWGFYFVGGLLIKCRIPARRQYQWLPVLVLVGAVALSVAYIFRILIFDIAAVNCLITVLLIESCIQCGLIRSNSSYKSLFHASSVAVQITDTEYHVCFSSGNAGSLREEERKRVAKGAMDISGYRFCCAAITNGYVFWIEDYTGLYRYRKELEEKGRQLSGANDLLRAELALQEKQLHIQEKNRLYDQVAKEIAPQLFQIDQLLKEKEEGKIQKTLARICVIGAYVKRRSNLLLLSEKTAYIPAKELELCLRESLENLKLFGVSGFLDADCSGTFPVAVLVEAYDICESALEKLLSELGALLLWLRATKEGQLLFRIQMDGDAACVDTSWMECLPELVDCEIIQAEALYITVRWPKKGAGLYKRKDPVEGGNANADDRRQCTFLSAAAGAVCLLCAA